MGPTVVAAHQGHEERLAERALEGEEAAFRALAGHSLDRVLNVCYRTCLDRAEAELVACEALAGVTRRLPELRLTGAGFGPLWLAAATGAVLDEAVRRVTERHRGPLPPEPHSAYCDPAAAARLADHQLLIRSAVARLHPRHRKLLALADGSGLSCAAIASLLGESVDAVAGSLGRARLGLAVELRGERSPDVPIADECAGIPSRFVLLDAGELGHAEQEMLSRHLARCPACAISARRNAEARTAYARWLDVVPSRAMLTRVRSLSPDGRRRAEALRILRSTAARRLVLASAASVSVFVIAAATVLRSDAPAPFISESDALVLSLPDLEPGEAREADARRGARERRGSRADRPDPSGSTPTLRGVEAEGDEVSRQRSRARAERERQRTGGRGPNRSGALAAESSPPSSAAEEPAAPLRGGGLLRESVGTLLGPERPRPVGIGRPRPEGEAESEQKQDPSGASRGGDRETKDEGSVSEGQ